MPPRYSDDSERTIVPLSGQCFSCGQGTVVASADASQGDDSSPPPYQPIATILAIQRQASSYGYDTFAHDPRSSVVAMRGPSPNYDIESVGSKGESAEQEALSEVKGIVVTAVVSAITVIAIWVLSAMLVDLIHQD